mgnify:FL=1
MRVSLCIGSMNLFQVADCSWILVKIKIVYNLTKKKLLVVADEIGVKLWCL